MNFEFVFHTFFPWETSPTSGGEWEFSPASTAAFFYILQLPYPLNSTWFPTFWSPFHHSFEFCLVRGDVSIFSISDFISGNGKRCPSPPFPALLLPVSPARTRPNLSNVLKLIFQAFDFLLITFLFPFEPSVFQSVVTWWATETCSCCCRCCQYDRNHLNNRVVIKFLVLCHSSVMFPPSFYCCYSSLRSYNFTFLFYFLFLSFSKQFCMSKDLFLCALLVALPFSPARPVVSGFFFKYDQWKTFYRTAVLPDVDLWFMLTPP